MYFHYVLSKDNNVKYAFNVVQYYYCTSYFLCFEKHFHVNVSKKKTVVTNYYLTKLVTTK